MIDGITGLRRMTTPSAGFAVLAGLALGTSTVRAADIDRLWLLPEGGTFNVAANWDPLGVPDPTDTAIFTITETFTVEFTASVSNKLLDVDEGEVTFDLTGFGYAANGIVVGNGTGKVGLLEILDGSVTVTPVVPPLNVRVGKDAGAVGSLEIAGGGSFTSADVVLIGDGGAGSMRVSSGGVAQTGRTVLGDDAGASGSVLVTGAASEWTGSDVLTIGNLGSGSMTVRLAGAVTSNGVFAADDPGSSATVEVDGIGSSWTENGTTNFGNAGFAEMDVTNGGVVTWSGISRLGDDLDAGGTVRVTGAGSRLDVGGEFFVGNLGTGAVTVSGGAALGTTRVKIGDETGSFGTVVLESGSTWIDSVEIFVGNFGVGTLDVSGAATVNGVAGTLGDDAGSNGTVVVAGAGSSWSNSSLLRIGDLGTGHLTVSGGGAANATSITLGVQAGGSGTATVDGLGSSLTASGQLQVGAAGNGVLRVVDGGRVNAQAGYTQTDDLEIVVGPDSANMIVVTGTASLGGALDVALAPGYTLPNGTSVTIIQGGTVAGAFASITSDPGLEVTVEPTRVIVTGSANECPADIDGDGAVGFGDILRILSGWGPCGICPEDLDGNGSVGFGDILIVLSSWGPCP